MKAADIPDEAFLAVVRSYNTGQHEPGRFEEYPEPRWAFYWEVAERLGVPEKVVLAKARRLIRRGLMTGCTCGCRGDFEVVTEAPLNFGQLLQGLAGRQP